MANTTILLSAILFSFICHADVYQLNEENFDEHTSTGLWYLEFYAPWCGHCKKFAPVYEEASNDPELDNINFGAIDATAQKAIAKRFDVSRFPTIKFFEDNVSYKYSGARTLESLKTMALKMLEPAVKEFDIKTFNTLNDRYTVSFLYIINDKNNDINHVSNNEIFKKTAMKFRPEIPFYSIKYSDLKKKGHLTDRSLSIDDKFFSNADSSILSITPSVGNKVLSETSFNEDNIKQFIEMNRYAPIIQLKLGNYKDLVENSHFFAIIFIDTFTTDSNKLMDDAEKLMIDNKEWNINTFNEYKQWELDNKGVEVGVEKADKVFMYKMIVSWCNVTEYNDWASHTFGIKEEELPLLLIYSPQRDGYWKHDDGEMRMDTFVDKVFSDDLEITFTRNWIARQAMKLERWLNGLSGWQIALVFIGVFVFLCGIMILLDYCCSPSQQPIKTD